MAKTTTKAARTSYSDETKIRAVREYLDPNRTASAEDIVAKHGISSTALLYSWKAAGWGDGYQPIGSAKPEAAPPTPAPNGLNGHALAPPASVEAWELARLRAENAELRSLLKKLL